MLEKIGFCQNVENIKNEQRITTLLATQSTGQPKLHYCSHNFMTAHQGCWKATQRLFILCVYVFVCGNGLQQYRTGQQKLIFGEMK